MAVDLLLDLDDELLEQLQRRADRNGTTVEEVIRSALSKGVGIGSGSLAPDATAHDRQTMQLDLRTK